MKVYEILSLNRNFLEKLHEFGINMSDVRWIDMYFEYARMKHRGEKTSYIAAVLSEKYNICERKVYKIIKVMERDCHIDAVG